MGHMDGVIAHWVAGLSETVRGHIGHCMMACARGGVRRRESSRRQVGARGARGAEPGRPNGRRPRPVPAAGPPGRFFREAFPPGEIPGARFCFVVGPVAGRSWGGLKCGINYKQ